MTAGGHNPGSSRRCKECKQRRKKCDLQRPQCLRCRKSGIVCSGPQSNATIFVNLDAHNLHSQTQRAALTEAYRHRTVDSRISSLLSSWEKAGDDIENKKADVQKLYSRSVLTANRSILPARNFQIETTYLALLDEFQPTRGVGIFSGDRMTRSASRHYSAHARCIRGLLPLASSSITAFDRCNMSLLALYYGRLHGDQGLVDFAQSSYTLALRLFSQAMVSQVSGVGKIQNRLLSMSVALIIYEQLNEVDIFGEGHLAHIHGALELLRDVGRLPIVTSKEMWNEYCGLRTIGVFVTIEQRRHTFLAEPEWLYLQNEHIVKSARDHLVDIALEIPALLNSADKITKSLKSSNKRVGSRLLGPSLRLINEFSALQRKFAEWLCGFKISTEQPLFRSRYDPSAVSSEDAHDTECKPKQTDATLTMIFHSAPVAGLLVHLWSFQLSLLMTSVHLQECLLAVASNTSPNESTSDVASETLSKGLSTDRILADETAHLILEAQPYLSSCLEGLLCVQLPMRVVARYFAQPTTKP